jgi:hypothetical protein
MSGIKRGIIIEISLFYFFVLENSCKISKVGGHRKKILNGRFLPNKNRYSLT